MKKNGFLLIYSVFLTIGICLNINSNAQYILAGKTTGENVYYFDIDDIYLVGEPNNPATWHFDIDGGWYDLEFHAYLDYGSNYTDVGTMVFPLDNTGISTLTDEENWIQQYFLGDTLSLNLNWYYDYGILRRYYWGNLGNSSTQGVFTGEGYMAFKIDAPDLMFGWIRLIAEWNELTICEYAFYSDTYVGLDHKDESNIKVKFQNPIEKNLLLLLDSNIKHCCFEYQLFDYLGAELGNGSLTPGNNIINMHALSAGIYILKVTVEDDFPHSYKVVKK